MNAGPTRTESMAHETIEQLLAYLGAAGATTLDLTGGAPELNPHFRPLVTRARAMGVKVIDRCNLTILEEPGQEDLAEFLASRQVEVVASLPCYTEELVDRQRGKGVYEKSVRGIRRLNGLGYGRAGSGLVLNLVYNPQGASLPPAQEKLEADYKRILGEAFGISFNALFTIANMPIQRFGSTLISKGQFNDYMALLRGAHRDENLEGVMCRSLVVGGLAGLRCTTATSTRCWGCRCASRGSAARTCADLAGRDLDGNPIVVRDHCYGCTAGQGSSCGGALACDREERGGRVAWPRASCPGAAVPRPTGTRRACCDRARSSRRTSLYVVGGLYGNVEALGGAAAMVARERAAR